LANRAIRSACSAQLTRCGLAVSTWPTTSQRCGPEGLHQRALLNDQDVYLDIVTELDSVQELVGLLEEIHRAQRHSHSSACGEVAVPAGFRVRDEPRRLGQGIHRPAHLVDGGRGLCQERQRLGPPHRVGVVLHVDEEVQGHGHRLVMAANILEGDPLDVAQELGAVPVTRTSGQEQTLPARQHGLLREPVDVQLVRANDEVVERSELAHGLERAACRPRHRSPILSLREPIPAPGTKDTRPMHMRTSAADATTLRPP